MMEPMYVGGVELPAGPLLILVGMVALAVGFSIIRKVKRSPGNGPDRWRSHRR